MTGKKKFLNTNSYYRIQILKEFIKNVIITKEEVSSHKKFVNMEEQSSAGVLQSICSSKYSKIHRKAAAAQSFFMKL